MGNVQPIRPEAALEAIERMRKNTDNSGNEPPTGGGGGSTLEIRVTKLENLSEKTGDRLIVMEKDIAIIKSQLEAFTKHYATKADLTDAKNSIIMWVVSAVLLAQLLPALLKKFGL